MELIDLSTLRGTDAWRAHETELKTRLTEIETQFAGVPLPDAERAEHKDIRERLDKKVRPTIEELEKRAAYFETIATDESRTEVVGEPQRRTSSTRTRTPEDIHDIWAYRSLSNSPEQEVRAMRDGAMREIEQAIFPHPNAKPDKIREHIARLLATDKNGELARYILSTSHPAYVKAFPGLVYGRPVSSEGARAADMVERAIATVGTTTTGGNAITYTFDPALMLTSDGAVNPLRQIARVETIITGNTWKGVTTAGLTLSRGPAEATAVTESTPTFGQPSVTAQPVKAELDFSIEADEDWPQLQSEMARIIQDGKDMEEAESFVNGVGTTVYPAGVVSTLAATSLVGTTGDGFDLTDIGVLTGRLPDRFEPRASFLAHRSVYNTIEDLQAALGGTSVSDLSAGRQASLRGYPRYNSSAMDSDVTTTGEQVLLFGDFRAGFIIVDKVGLRIELDPHVRDGNGKWTGQRALLAHYRNSSDILIDNAFRLLQIGVVTTGI